ncbi:hypothetical protein KC19_7G019400 [Ceratodon purpureus]|uniref:Uncharacterized protein n=1 Tax=Ceratodon purpureus TaxID=3225 RepID=A0A8T0H3H7_CERPU|nr:hypothetical protein KC19_7G019400 [Ceratodon purpureus]
MLWNSLFAFPSMSCISWVVARGLTFTTRCKQCTELQHDFL